MTCADFLAMRGRGIRGATASEMTAMLKHIIRCQACNDVTKKILATYSDEEEALLAIVSLAMLPKILEHVTTDSEAT